MVGDFEGGRQVVVRTGLALTMIDNNHTWKETRMKKTTKSVGDGTAVIWNL